jgi:hypothetical protein
MIAGPIPYRGVEFTDIVQPNFVADITSGTIEVSRS